MEEYDFIGSGREAQFKHYIALIRETPLLTLEEESALGETIMAGRRAAEQLKRMEQGGGDDLPREAREYREKMRAAELARRKLVEHNLRLAAYLARKFYGRGIAMSDLVQEANLALMKAAENWDYTPGDRFAGLAGAYINGALRRCCEKVSVIHVPFDMTQAVTKIRRVANVLNRQFGSYPRPEALARELNVSVEIIDNILEASRLSDLPASLDKTVSEESDTTLAELTPDPAAGAPEEVVITRVLQEKLNAILSTLEPAEEKVIRLRFGFEDGAIHSAEDTGRICSCSLEQIRQLEARAIRKLRHPSRSSQLTGFLY